MKYGDPEPITDINRSGDLLDWIHNIGAMKLSVVIMHSIVDAFNYQCILFVNETT